MSQSVNAQSVDTPPVSLRLDFSMEGIAGAIADVVSFVHGGPDIRRGQRLASKDEQRLAGAFNTANMTKDTFHMYLRDVAEEVMGLDPDTATVMAPMKQRQRAAEKLKTPDRSAFGDIVRGRIVFEDVQEYKRFVARLKGSQELHEDWGKREGRGVWLQPDSVSNYLKNPRAASGYAGSINLNVDVDCKKNRMGSAEIQVMPRVFIETYDQSHLLFEMIRHISETPKAYRSEGQEKLREALVAYNTALWDAAARKHGFMKLRDEEPAALGNEELLQRASHASVLGRLMGQMEGSASKSPRFQETIEALYAAQQAFESEQKTRTPGNDLFMQYAPDMRNQDFQPAATFH